MSIGATQVPKICKEGQLLVLAVEIKLSYCVGWLELWSKKSSRSVNGLIFDLFVYFFWCFGIVTIVNLWTIGKHSTVQKYSTIPLSWVLILSVNSKKVILWYSFNKSTVHISVSLRIHSWNLIIIILIIGLCLLFKMWWHVCLGLTEPYSKFGNFGAFGVLGF